MIVRKYYNPICYEDVEVGDTKLVNKKDFENFKNMVDEIKNKENNKVFIFDSLGIEHIKSDFNRRFIMKLIPDWRNKNLQCHFCNETRSVKYTMKIFDPVVDNKPTEVCVCNKCALRYNNNVIKEA